MLGLGGDGPRRRRRHGRRREASAVVGSGAMARKRGGEERRTVEELTADPTASSASSGKAWGSRSDDGDLVGRSLKTTAMAMKRSSPGLLCSVRRERGSRRSWEACRGGEGRPVAAATASGGGDGARVCEGESRGRGGGRGRVREGSGWLRGVSGASRRGGERAGRQRGRWRGAAERARVGHAPVLLSGRKTTEEGARWAGLASWAGQAAQCWASTGAKRQVRDRKSVV